MLIIAIVIVIVIINIELLLLHGDLAWGEGVGNLNRDLTYFNTEDTTDH